jgi:hypothetical protein
MDMRGVRREELGKDEAGGMRDERGGIRSKGVEVGS